MDEYVFLYFSEFELESPTFDNMTIYDGDNTGAPILINGVGNTELSAMSLSLIYHWLLNILLDKK